MSRWIDIDDDRNCYIGNDGEYERWNIDPDVLDEALPSAQPEPLTINFARELDRETIEKVKESMKNAPVLIMAVNDDSAQTERKKGRWIKHKDRACWYCSECKAVNYYAYSWNCDTKEDELQDHYCPNCGAEMRGEEE